MWMCDCDEHGKFDARYFDKKPTTVTGDGICVRCENYAFWENPKTKRAENGEHTQKKVTIFKLKTGKSKKFDSMVKAAKWAGYKSKYTLSYNFTDEATKFYYNEDMQMVAVLGHHNTLPKEVKKGIKPTQHYCFDYETGELLFSGSLDEVLKVGKEKRHIVLSNLNRSTIKTKKGRVYSKNKNFNVEVYKKSMEIPPELQMDINWREDIISFNNEELGVKYEEDNYGTWKELLYS